ncbi:uncharacterized protein LOC127136037 [Lathyrus oleraceus]|uniref:uncharacterized protein LOC127136037 n=1 Tax=Pisum sativum TaxID=3888 RepID=UPI0021CEDC59|nr:uncharacterized protein LOC127136037 [Pisum sativum]
MVEFSAFIEDMDLVDVHSLGGVFTWFNSAGSSMSRLDRFLLLDKVVSNWKIAEIYWKRAESINNIWRSLNVKKNIIRQKSRLSWLKEGDLNTSFFHNAMKDRFRRNAISFVNTDEGIVESIEEWSRLPFEDSQTLEESFSDSEIRDDVWSCDSNKSPGPDGYRFGFLKKSYWEISKVDVFRFVKDFHSNARLFKAVTLIPKVLHPQHLSNYKPICLVSCFHKTLAKILTGRLKVVLGFGIKWKAWMEVVVFSSSMSTLVNGSAIMDFRVETWLRQSDPLLSFLFVIAMEGLTHLMKKAVVLKEFSGFLMNDDVSFDILQFVDDTIIFGAGSWSNLLSIKVILREFEFVLGLCIKLRKSNIFGVNMDTHF